MGLFQRESEKPYHVDFTASFSVPADFGLPGAILVANAHSKEVFLSEIVIHGFGDGPIFFPAHTFIQPQTLVPNKRIIFSSQEYLPSQTPGGLKDLRQEDLASLQGNGKGERKTHERIYDYDVYNDLGDPEKSEDLARPVLGGSQMPYPRRCRTGRPPMKSDPRYESSSENSTSLYVPRDEAFEDIKDKSMSASSLKSVLNNLIPVLTTVLSKSDRNFTAFSEIEDLYKDGISLNPQGDDNILWQFLGKITNIHERLKYDLPLTISRDRFSWLRDSEFARQTLAGVNPGNIERLREFPILSKLDPEEYGPPESAITREIIEGELSGMTLEKAMEEKRLFVLDYHDMLLPFIKRMNSQEGRKSYASRTVFFYNSRGVLQPVAIELSPPPTSSEPQNKKVYTRGHHATEQWIWRLAKAHVCSNDSGVHQLVSHWLKTHACMEPCIIAAHRQLSMMHPVFKLLHPHLRYTLEINALARQTLINGGGVIENGFSTGKYSMELSAAAYESLWRFDMEALPADLLRRGMAEEDPSSPHGIKLVIEDYPYAADGLLIWSAIESYATDYLSQFYPSSAAIAADVELQAWWAELRSRGHPEKAHEPWWPTLSSLADLIHIITTLIWTASGLHAAINFGQYPLGGFMPNRPAMMKKLIPEEGSQEFDKMVKHPQEAFLQSLPTMLEATRIMSVQDTLSTHSPDEEYLGTDPDSGPGLVAQALERFSKRLDEVDEVIKARNSDPKLKNRTGAGVPPYELLMRSSGPGATARGIPNSISI
ncbi:lipoxygenase 6, chloroplastic-like [Wolffia australiana]